MKSILYIINCLKASIGNTYRVHYVREIEGKLCAVPVVRIPTFFGIKQLDKFEMPIIITEGNMLFSYEGIEKDKGKLVLLTLEYKYVPFRFFHNLFNGGSKMVWDKKANLDQITHTHY